VTTLNRRRGDMGGVNMNDHGHTLEDPSSRKKLFGSHPGSLPRRTMKKDTHPGRGRGKKVIALIRTEKSGITFNTFPRSDLSEIPTVPGAIDK